MGKVPMRGAVAVGLVAAVLAGCAIEPRIPPDALQFHPQTLQRRQVQTRLFDTADEELILAASAGLIQDLGFTIDESETDLGVIVGSKRRDAMETGQVIRSVLTTLAGAALSFGTYWTASEPIDDVQLIRASLVSAPAGDTGSRMAVRITFQRIVWNTDGDISRREAIHDPAIYEEFFDGLSRSVFLEAHRI